MFLIPVVYNIDTSPVAQVIHKISREGREFFIRMDII